jgi:hypothetical protein
MDVLTGVSIILVLFVLRFALPFGFVVVVGRLTERFARNGG